jgi:hypothetical protein
VSRVAVAGFARGFVAVVVKAAIAVEERRFSAALRLQ